MSAFLSIRVIDICSECGGTGNDNDALCVVCTGSGLIDIQDVIDFEDVSGMASNGVLRRVPGESR